MAPRPRAEASQSLNARNAGSVNASTSTATATAVVNDELFLEPMMGTPLAIFIQKEVLDRDQLIEIITKHGGTVSPGYSGVPYILVNPHTEAGQSLFRQYVGKKGKIVLNARWVHECVKKGELQTYHTNWAGCKVTGKEPVYDHPHQANGSSTSDLSTLAQRRGRPPTRVPPQAQPQPLAQVPQQAHPQSAPPVQPQSHLQVSSTPSSYAHPQSLQPVQPSILNQTAPLVPSGFSYPVYASQNAQHVGRAQITASAPPPQTWQAPASMTPHPHASHLQMVTARSQNPYVRDEHWNEPGTAFAHLPAPESHALHEISDNQSNTYYDQRYRDDQGAWPDNGQDYYEPHPSYNQPYQEQQEQFVQISGPSGSSTAQPVHPPVGHAMEREPVREPERGRKRTRAQPVTAASTLVLSRRHPPARSPTPPTRVIKSTYGGNLFTADDVMYLKKYIDYCQEQGLVLSLREICERIAVKAPHHTFYSWRRYCNKHQIRLGGYAMDVESRSPSPSQQENGHFNDDGEVYNHAAPLVGEGPFTITAAQRLIQEQGLRNRSPTPPRALYRSTTGKGVAFTAEDVAFVCKFMAYRKAQERLDMVTFWKDVAAKAPHHSRASWMKYYRRHKHELNRTEGDEPLPAPPAKKMRYGRNDDILLAKYFVNKPEGTSDKIFQNFAKLYPHHPWKGWQEHYRIHKANIDHLIQRIASGETLELGDEDQL